MIHFTLVITPIANTEIGLDSNNSIVVYHYFLTEVIMFIQFIPLKDYNHNFEVYSTEEKLKFILMSVKHFLVTID